MALLSFLFVWRGLSHTHQIVGETQTIAAFDQIDPETKLSAQGKRVSANAIKSAVTTYESGHQHRIELVEDVRGVNDPRPNDTSNIFRSYERSDGKTVFERVVVVPYSGHTHRVTITGEGDSARIVLGPAIGYSELGFLCIPTKCVFSIEPAP